MACDLLSCSSLWSLWLPLSLTNLGPKKEFIHRSHVMKNSHGAAGKVSCLPSMCSASHPSPTSPPSSLAFGAFGAFAAPAIGCLGCCGGHREQQLVPAPRGASGAGGAVAWPKGGWSQSVESTGSGEGTLGERLAYWRRFESMEAAAGSRLRLWRFVLSRCCQWEGWGAEVDWAEAAAFQLSVDHRRHLWWAEVLWLHMAHWGERGWHRAAWHRLRTPEFCWWSGVRSRFGWAFAAWPWKTPQDILRSWKKMKVYIMTMMLSLGHLQKYSIIYIVHQLQKMRRNGSTAISTAIRTTFFPMCRSGAAGGVSWDQLLRFKAGELTEKLLEALTKDCRWLGPSQIHSVYIWYMQLYM